jgi:phage terminase large subunit-like protein
VKQTNRIDGIVALVMALGRAAFGKGAVKESVYEKRAPLAY